VASNWTATPRGGRATPKRHLEVAFGPPQRLPLAPRGGARHPKMTLGVAYWPPLDAFRGGRAQPKPLEVVRPPPNGWLLNR
jgi:hypothetical protein